MHAAAAIAKNNNGHLILFTFIPPRGADFIHCACEYFYFTTKSF